MTVFFYNIFLFFFQAGVRLAALWNKKAELWLSGRKNIFNRILESVKPGHAEIAWMHCSSLGEFEQGRPVLEKLRQQYPRIKILLTFFSPSGYEIRKNYDGATWVFYLPLDTKKNATRFLDIVKPSLVIFVKYEYWYHYINTCRQKGIPLLMISAVFRKNQPFFRWYGTLHRKMLSCFSQFFVQDEKSKNLLTGLQLQNIIVAGDTRFDRVADIAKKFEPISEIERFCENSTILVAGSTWPEDEKIIKEAVSGIPNLKLIIAPHEIEGAHIEKIKSLFPGCLLHSELKSRGLPIGGENDDLYKSNCLVIDNVGMLSKLYHYATISYVGGGFGKGIHNTLEAAVHGKLVIFGPRYEKFLEAKNLINSGGGISILSATELKTLLERLLSDKSELKQKSNSAYEFVQQNKGATAKIIGYIEEKRLLTN